MTALLGIFIGRLATFAMVEKISNSTISIVLNASYMHILYLIACICYYMAGSGERSSVDLQIDLFV